MGVGLWLGIPCPREMGSKKTPISCLATTNRLVELLDGRLMKGILVARCIRVTTHDYARINSRIPTLTAVSLHNKIFLPFNDFVMYGCILAI